MVTVFVAEEVMKLIMHGEKVLAYTRLFEFSGVHARPNNSLFNSDCINLGKLKL